MTTISANHSDPGGDGGLGGRKVAPRHGAELTLFAACLIFSLLFYAGALGAMVFLTPAGPWAILAVVFWAAILWIIGLFVRAGFVAHLRGNGLMLGDDQLPAVQQCVERACSALGLRGLRQVYLVQAGGVREAMVRLFLGSKILVLSSKLVDDNLGGAELDMKIARELAHLKYRHIVWDFWLLPSALLPLLYPAWRRATEYTADRCGLLACGEPATAERAMFISAAGGKLGRKVQPDAYRARLPASGGFWSTMALLLSGEPAINWRAGQLLRALAGPAQAPPGARRSILAGILCLFAPGAVALRGRSALAGALLVIAIIAVAAAAWIVPALGLARTQSSSAHTMANMMQLSRATRLYAVENKDLLPPTLDDLVPYLDGGRELLNGPSGTRIVYVVENARLRRVQMSDFGYDMILMFCEQPGDTFVVLYGDGHVQRLDMPEFQRQFARVRQWLARQRPAPAFEAER